MIVLGRQERCAYIVPKIPASAVKKENPPNGNPRNELATARNYAVFTFAVWFRLSRRIGCKTTGRRLLARAIVNLNLS